MKMLIFNKIKIIGFDADDTLCVNEPYYREAENTFCKMVGNYLPPDRVSKELFTIEMQNLDRYGYGAKSFILKFV